MLNYIAENKRIINLHEQKSTELAVFQANSTIFQANTNASLKNLEIQVRQLTLNMHNRSKDSFPSDTKKNPKDCMAITLRSGEELQYKKEVEKKQMDDETEGKDRNPIGNKKGRRRNELLDDIQQLKEQSEMQTEKTLQKKKEVGVY